MAKLPRQNQKVFGQTAPVTQMGVFGSLAASDPTYSKDIEELQSLGAFEAGWYTAIQGNDSPSVQEMNSVMYVCFYQLSYLFQQGIPEWDDETEYHISSVVTYNGANYIAIQNDNTNHLPTDLAWWRPFVNEIETGSDFVELDNKSGEVSTKIILTKNLVRKAEITRLTITEIYSDRVTRGEAELASRYPLEWPPGGLSGTDAYLWEFLYIGGGPSIRYIWNGFFWEPEPGTTILFLEQRNDESTLPQEDATGPTFTVNRNFKDYNNSYERFILGLELGPDTFSTNIINTSNFNVSGARFRVKASSTAYRCGYSRASLIGDDGGTNFIGVSSRNFPYGDTAADSSTIESTVDGEFVLNLNFNWSLQLRHIISSASGGTEGFGRDTAGILSPLERIHWCQLELIYLGR